MKRIALVLSAIVVLAFAAALATGCTTPAADPTQGDGLHSTVPDVIGMDEQMATETLEEAGYVVGDVTTASDENAGPGEVIEQDPIPTTSLPRGEAVNLVLAEPPL